MLYRFLTSDYPITVVLLVTLVAWARWQRATVLDMVRAPSARWAFVGRVALGATLALVVWVALFDNWRHLLGLFLPAGERWASDPYETAPTPWPWRVGTFVLLALSVGGTALVYAYNRGSLWLPLGLLVPARAYVYFIDPIRQRTDVLLRMAEGKLESARLVDIAGTLYWAVGLYLLIASVLLAAWVFLWSVSAPVAKLVVWAIYRTRETHPSERFSLYERHAEAMRRAGKAPAPPSNHSPE